MIATAASVAMLALPTIAEGKESPARQYSVTITNLTYGQPLSPPVIATHNGRGKVFHLGETARYGVQQVAENGRAGLLVDELNVERALGNFDDVVRSSGGPLVPPGLPASALGDRVTLTITASGSGARLSWVSMLACTNDGFAGLDGLRLPRDIGETVVAQAGSYDAGSELNSESFADLVGGCQAAVGVRSLTGATGTGASNPALSEGGVVTAHAGVLGVAADGLVPSIHGWDDPVASVSVTRIS